MMKLIQRRYFSLLSAFSAFLFILTTSAPPMLAQGVYPLSLPVPGTLVNPSSAFVPVLLKGMTIHPDDPLKFDFILDSGNTSLSREAMTKESERLVKYFLASMTIPKDDFWVNLSPYEKELMIPEELGRTDLGRDLLEQDYILKQLTASLIYPERDLGKKFWDRVYQQAREKMGTTEIPINTFNKVWILPQSATVYENGQTVYIVQGRLKVLLDQDYVALQNNRNNKDLKMAELSETQVDDSSSISSNIIREIVLPEIEKEVNEGENFAPLRQIYYSLILAKWYKETIKGSLLSHLYVNQKKTTGIELDDQTVKDQIYDQYMEAFKKGVFDYIKNLSHK